MSAFFVSKSPVVERLKTALLVAQTAVASAKKLGPNVLEFSSHRQPKKVAMPRIADLQQLVRVTRSNKFLDSDAAQAEEFAALLQELSDLDLKTPDGKAHRSSVLSAAFKHAAAHNPGLLAVHGKEAIGFCQKTGLVDDKEQAKTLQLLYSAVKQATLELAPRTVPTPSPYMGA